MDGIETLIAAGVLGSHEYLILDYFQEQNSDDYICWHRVATLDESFLSSYRPSKESGNGMLGFVPSASAFREAFLSASKTNTAQFSTLSPARHFPDRPTVYVPMHRLVIAGAVNIFFWDAYFKLDVESKKLTGLASGLFAELIEKETITQATERLAQRFHVPPRFVKLVANGVLYVSELALTMPTGPLTGALFLFNLFDKSKKAVSLQDQKDFADGLKEALEESTDGFDFLSIEGVPQEPDHQFTLHRNALDSFMTKAIHNAEKELVKLFNDKGYSATLADFIQSFMPLAADANDLVKQEWQKAGVQLETRVFLTEDCQPLSADK